MRPELFAPTNGNCDDYDDFGGNSSSSTLESHNTINPTHQNCNSAATHMNNRSLGSSGGPSRLTQGLGRFISTVGSSITAIWSGLTSEVGKINQEYRTAVCDAINY
jgi:hypothetical protein